MNIDAELISKITADVLQAIGAGEVSSPAAAPVKTSQTQSTAAAATAAPATTQNNKAVIPPSPRRVFITADMVESKMAGNSGTLNLAHNEFLTPNADDYVHAKSITLARQPKPSIMTVPSVPTAAAEPTKSADLAKSNVHARANIGIVVERPDVKVTGVIDSLASDGIAAIAYNINDCWMENTRLLCRDTARGKIDAGVLILPYAADAMVLANKAKGTRAVQGTRSESVRAAVRSFGANVLVLEHAFSTFHEMRTMIRAFVGQRASAGNYEKLLTKFAVLEGE